MFLRLAVATVPFLVGCSAPLTTNPTQVDELEQVYEFNVVDKHIALKRSMGFIEDVNKFHKKSEFEVFYDPQESEFVAELIENARREGIHRHRISATIKGSEQSRQDSQPLSNKAISIVSRYTLVNDKHCQTLHMGSVRTFQFGCAVEYNRVKSLVKPLKGVE
ncbi:conserved hypothetical protein [Vibrio nigripulchritudo SFn27]|uniref:Uncharacterized protein n=1 Tax=Vibrio nigripulchritudo TaxID=28173 RepID=U4KC84_9VIBR|nr:hypothetical protein [Vibrio nigripulchritudo]KJY80805.1 hypothetical protein TW74_00445 [Vibrio nigripulchritudo]CCN83442.1 conserved hypothetical protein [Vibrio nigripulchritudo BLFn1]CCN88801.1 conserved hypothetical protein [Vibrio nigripulchritudo SFn27]CCN94972.1 conserved hypothetical protein [Vibrio nigripulchritudo ENn2]CCO41146.1 conserved hypothetical protein [Vibrio nigripulchritudo SFn135]